MKKAVISIIFLLSYLFSAAQYSDNSGSFYTADEASRIELKMPAGESTAGSKSDSIYNISDKDRNLYHVIKIGSQTWMAENLKTTRFNDGTSIPIVSDYKLWSKMISPGYCLYNNDPVRYKTKYGILYNGYTVSTGKLCPLGWHVPSVEDWLILTNFYGEKIAGGKLKEKDSWMSPNTGATNSSGFTALPGGSRGDLGSFMDVGIRGHWWSSTETGKTEVWNKTMSYSNSGVSESSDNKQSGLSVRCMKDN